MGLFDSLSSSVAGMQAQTFALQNISGNIANSQTPAYKTTDTSFRDLLNSQGSADQSSGGVQAQSTNNNTLQGAIQTAKTSTYMAVQGDGYFTVQKPSAVASGGQPSISDSSPVYTRRGDFQTDSNGYLVNGAGYYLMGNPVDPSTGKATGGTPQALQVNAANLPTDQGKLESLSINSKGQLQGTFSSGKTVSLAEILCQRSMHRIFSNKATAAPISQRLHQGQLKPAPQVKSSAARSKHQTPILLTSLRR